MHRQVGDLALDNNGVARRGLLVRHLVLPDGLAGTREVMEFLAREISPNTYVNVMGQYRPCGRASEHASLRKFLTGVEHAEAMRLALEAGLTRLDRREKLFRWL
jgi:putative pyruvate formate lyase activating enzyme